MAVVKGLGGFGNVQEQLHKYDTTLDRVGFALAVGGLLGGGFTTGLVAAGSPPSTVGLIVGFVVGTVISAMTVIAVVGPVWLACHIIGKRGPGTAMLIGALAGFLLFLGGQTYGFGLFDAPPSDALTLLFRWLSGIATSLILAGVSALIGLAMWRVAYRRVPLA